jgi:signal transduction histidine kinase/CheY-like chemotaxis protein
MPRNEPKDWLRVTLDSLGDAVITADAEGKVTYVNPAAERLIGDGAGDGAVQGRPIHQLLRLVDEGTGRPVDIVVSPEGVREAAALARRPLRLEGQDTGRRFYAKVEPIGSNGRFAGAVLRLYDAAEQLRLESELRESHQADLAELKRQEEDLKRRTEDLAGADRRKDQFLAMLAHELRNPLAPIRNAVELMRQVETIDPTFQPAREMVERQVKHLARLVDDLLDVSRITHGSIRLRKEAVDLGDVVERAIEATRALIDSRGHELTLRLPTDPIRLEADPTRLEQVIANLLNNAAKYTMPGGHIWVTAEVEGGEAKVRVRDNGIGVPPDVLDRVFEPFVQSEGSLARSEGGLGIGLTLVRSLVEMHGGRVEAHSPGLGQGSEFMVRLPARLPARMPARLPSETATPVPAPDAPFASRGLRVLVVEDNVDAAESLAALVRLWGHEVDVVHDGLTAIDAAREMRPEVVLLDIGLPGLDGYQVARKLREDVGLDGTMLVAMTGYGQPEDRRRSREAGIHHHFVKPVEPFVLRTLLANLGAPAPVAAGAGRPF